MNKKILDNGTLVYSKEYGQGLIWCYKPIIEMYNILFEGHNPLISLGRESLFVKGDRVSNKLKDIYFIYEGYASFLKYPYAVEDNNEQLHYLDEIYRVKEKDTIEITVKINGKEVPLNTLSIETLEKIRATENNHE